jgi:ribosomal-protein-alanine N-acetyltransferase
VDLTITQGYTSDDIDRLYELEKVSFSRVFRWLKCDFVAALKDCDTIQGVYNNRIAGYVLGEVESDAGHIVSLTVDPAYRRMGFGSKLMEAAEVFYKKKGMKKIRLEVHLDNPAQILYFNLGYRVNGFKPKYYANGSPAIVMVKPLKVR